MGEWILVVLDDRRVGEALGFTERQLRFVAPAVLMIQAIAHAQAGIGVGIVRIELDGAPKTCHPSVEDLAILFRPEHQLATLEKQVVRLDIPGAATGDTGFLSIAQGYFQRTDDVPRDVILDVEYVGEIAVIALCP